MSQLDPQELSRQLKKPSGETGREVAKRLNASNRSLYELAFSMLDLQPKEQLLEVGFGNGAHFFQYFDVQPNIKIIGVDFSADMCKEARDRNKALIKEKHLQRHCSSADAIPTPDNTFDWVLALNVLYFWGPPAPTLKEFSGYLNPMASCCWATGPQMVEHLAFTKKNFILYEAE